MTPTIMLTHLPPVAILDVDGFAAAQEESLEVLSACYCWIAKTVCWTTPTSTASLPRRGESMEVLSTSYHWIRRTTLIRRAITSPPWQ